MSAKKESPASVCDVGASEGWSLVMATPARYPRVESGRVRHRNLTGRQASHGTVGVAVVELKMVMLRLSSSSVKLSVSMRNITIVFLLVVAHRYGGQVCANECLRSHVSGDDYDDDEMLISSSTCLKLKNIVESAARVAYYRGITRHPTTA